MTEKNILKFPALFYLLNNTRAKIKWREIQNSFCYSLPYFSLYPRFVGIYICKSWYLLPPYFELLLFIFLLIWFEAAFACYILIFYKKESLYYIINIHFGLLLYIYIFQLLSKTFS